MSDELRHAGLPLDPDRLIALRIGSALAGALGASLSSLVLPIGPAVVALGGYAGFVAPALVVSRRAAAERRLAEAAAVVLIERVHALVAAGRPPESALGMLLPRRSGSAVLDGVLRSTAEAYALGAPMFRTLASRAREEGLSACVALAEDLERSRDLGSGALATLRELRGSLRSAERARMLSVAAQVEGKLMLVLVLCYLPALVLLVVVPLFIGLLDGLFA